MDNMIPFYDIYQLQSLIPWNKFYLS